MVWRNTRLFESLRLKTRPRTVAGTRDSDVAPIHSEHEPERPEQGSDAQRLGREEGVSSAAIEWFLLLNDLAITDAKRIEFATWVAKDPKHQIAMKEVERLWFLMGEALKVDSKPGMTRSKAISQDSES